jgi:hypothetical protein
MTSPPRTDAELLEEVLDMDDLPEGAHDAFSDMQHKGRPLSANQRAWIEASLEGKPYEPPVEPYENLVSDGKVPRGKEVPTPEVLKRLPLKPPRKVTT